MRKNLNKIIIIFGLIFLNLLCFSFCHEVSAAVSKGELETHTYGVFGKLQSAAKNSEKAYFEFDPTALLGSEKGKLNIFGQGYDVSDKASQSACCISADNHAGATEQKITCIIDVSSKGVTVYKKNIKGEVIRKTTTSGDEVDTVKRMAYYAYKSVQKGESLVRTDYLDYKCLIRFRAFCDEFTNLDNLGVPEYFRPHGSPGVGPDWYTWANNIDQEYRKTGKSFRGRFILLYSSERTTE